MAEFTISSSKSKSLSSQHCCVPLCTSDSRYDQSLHFHQIPSDAELKKQWIIKIRRDEGPLFKVTKSTVVCSKHFQETDYKKTPVRKMLKPGTIPTVFDWSKQNEPRRALKRKILAVDNDQKSKTQKSECDQEPANEFEFQAELFDEQPSESTTMLQDNRINELEQRLAEKEEECYALKQQLEVERFGIHRFSKDTSMMSFYTGFQSYKTFIAFFSCIKPAASNMQSTMPVVKQLALLDENEICFS